MDYKHLSKFQGKYPEAGQIERGTHITGEQARQFGDIVSAKVAALSRRESLTPSQQTFIDTTMNLAARTIVYLDRKGVRIQDTQTAEIVARDNAALLGLPERVGFAGLSAQFEEIAANPDMSMRHNPTLRSRVEDVAMNSMSLMGEMIAKNGGADIDDYLAGNLQAIIGQYENVDNDPTPLT